MSKLVKANEATAARRRCYFHLVDETDGKTPETGEAAGQPQVSTNGAAFTDTGIGTLTHLGNGRYYADLTQTLVATAGDQIETRYKSAATAECPGDSFQVVAFDPYDIVRIGLTAIPNVAQGNAGQLPTATAAGLVTLAGVTHTGAVIPTVSEVTGAVGSVTGAVGSVTGNVSGNVSGSVGSVVGAVGGSVASVTGAVGSVTGNVGGNVVGSVASVTAAVTVGTNNDKTGYGLASTGLDSISTTAPSGVASNFREMLVQTWRRFFKNTTLTSTQLKTYADDGTTVVTTQAVSDDGTTETVGSAS